ncbi:MAG TPA: TetR/AcrR family transcriptional regulator, partial [Desulfurivibrionaceae bacterium]|nr:TetR/AcrR family transcriptional regulator [Desulfurivibrionaceae bacterium]
TFNNLPADKQELILREAVREFGDYGFRQASVNRIVERTGIAKGSLYQYFANKEALFFYVFGRFAELIKLTVREAAGECEDDFFIRMGQVMRAGEGFVRNHPDHFRLYLKLAADGDIPQRAHLLGLLRLFPAEYFAPLLEQGQREGRIRSDVRLEAMIFLIEGVIERFLQGLGGAAQLDGDLVEELITLLRDGLAPASGN